jgi:hypothetical protein
MGFYSFCDLYLLDVVKIEVRIATILMKNNDFYKYIIECISIKSEMINKITFL